MGGEGGENGELRKKVFKTLSTNFYHIFAFSM